MTILHFDNKAQPLYGHPFIEASTMFKWSLAFERTMYVVLSGVLIHNKGALCASLLITYATSKLLTPYPIGGAHIVSQRSTTPIGGRSF